MLASTSSAPNSLLTDLASDATASSERTSSFVRNAAFRPFSFLSSRSVAITLAPSAINASAIARPMPWPAAVTRATFPFNLPAMCCPFEDRDQSRSDPAQVSVRVPGDVVAEEVAIALVDPEWRAALEIFVDRSHRSAVQARAHAEIAADAVLDDDIFARPHQRPEMLERVQHARVGMVGIVDDEQRPCQLLDPFGRKCFW